MDLRLEISSNRQKQGFPKWSILMPPKRGRRPKFPSALLAAIDDPSHCSIAWGHEEMKATYSKKKKSALEEEEEEEEVTGQAILVSWSAFVRDSLHVFFPAMASKAAFLKALNTYGFVGTHDREYSTFYKPGFKRGVNPALVVRAKVDGKRPCCKKPGDDEELHASAISPGEEKAKLFTPLLPPSDDSSAAVPSDDVGFFESPDLDSKELSMRLEGLAGDYCCTPAAASSFEDEEDIKEVAAALLICMSRGSSVQTSRQGSARCASMHACTCLRVLSSILFTALFATCC